jgi:hypothetical protein
MPDRRDAGRIRHEMFEMDDGTDYMASPAMLRSMPLLHRPPTIWASIMR